MAVQHKNLTDKIHLLIFDTQKQITSTFLRFQEHYESPEFRGKFFSLEEFREWYVKNSPNGKKTGKFTYYSDWSGFNIPSYILRPFYKGRFNPLSKKENNFLEIFSGEREPFYIIGVHREEKLQPCLRHEISHGLFYTDGNYRNEVLYVLSKFDIKPIKEKIRLKGYNEAVLVDECHAFGIDHEKILENVIPKELSNSLRTIYKKYLKIHDLKLFT